MANQQAAFPGAPMVVPSGFRWSVADAERQATRRSFLRVGPIRRTKQGANANPVRFRSLSGAVKKSWSSTDPEELNTIFNVQYRITGTPENVRLALQYAGVPAQEIERVIADSITANNYQTTKAREYQQELAAYQGRVRAGPSQPGYGINELLWFAQNLPAAYSVNNRGTTTGKAAGRAAGRGGGGKSLLAAYQAAAASGKFVDVSNIDNVTGAGYKTRKTRPKTVQGGVGTADIPIVSKDLENYIRALEIIFGPDARQQYAAQIEQVRGMLAPAPTVVAMQAARFPGAPAQAGFPPLRPGAALVGAPVLQTAGAPAPAVASPLRTYGAAASGMLPFQTVRQ